MRRNRDLYWTGAGFKQKTPRCPLHVSPVYPALNTLRRYPSRNSLASAAARHQGFVGTAGCDPVMLDQPYRRFRRPFDVDFLPRPHE